MNTEKSQVTYRNKFLPDFSYICLFALTAVYTVFFSILSIDRHNRLQTSSFDLGINDQSIWQFAHFHTPFNTVRGLNTFGDHFTLINAMTSPIYWFADDVRILLVFQSLVFAAGAVPLYFIAREYLNRKYLPLIFCFSYLMFPALHYVNLEDYHPELFIPFFLLTAFYFVIKKRQWPYLLFLFLTLSCKEEVALTTFMLGIYVYFTFDKKVGIFTCLFSFAWFMMVVNIIGPYYNGHEYLYSGRLWANYGQKPVDIFLNFINPVKMFPVIFNQTNGKFVWELFAPVGFLSWLNPATMVLAASFWLNLIISWPYAHNIYYHHVIPIIPIVFISLVAGIARYKEEKIILTLLITVLIVSSLASNWFIAPHDASVKNYGHIMNKIREFGKPMPRETQLQMLMGKIPPNASVSASFMVVPHLTHRDKIYDFPNPFKSSNWGNGKEEPPLEYVDYLLLSNEHMGDYSKVLQRLLDGKKYRTELRSNCFTLYRRVKCLE